MFVNAMWYNVAMAAECATVSTPYAKPETTTIPAATNLRVSQSVAATPASETWRAPTMETQGLARSDKSPA